MRIAFYSLALTALLILGTTGCDFSEQNVSWEPGDSLFVIGPVDAAGTDISEPEPSDEGLPVVISPVDAYFYVNAFTTEREYIWTVNGTNVEELDNVRRLNQGEFVRISFTDPGTYTIRVQSGGLSGSQQVAVEEAEPDEVGTEARP